MQDKDYQTVLWISIVTMVVLGVPAWALAAATGGAIPQISSLVGQIRGTIEGPVAITLFTAGVVKVGQNVYKRGGIEGLADGGIGVAAAGAIIGGSGWLASQLGVTGALVP